MLLWTAYVSILLLGATPGDIPTKSRARRRLELGRIAATLAIGSR